jgi:hypothetical protein
MGDFMKIAFGYKARSGKDTSAEYLQGQYGGQIFKFAQPIYDIMKATHEIAGVDTFKDTKLLTWVGTDWGRSIDENIWVDHCLNKIHKAERQGCYLSNESFVNNFYVTDVRFPNEAEALKNNGFFLVKVDRKTRPQEERASHMSENALNDYKGWDFVIDNNGHLEDLYDQLQSVVQVIKISEKYNIK